MPSPRLPRNILVGLGLNTPAPQMTKGDVHMPAAPHVLATRAGLARSAARSP